MEYVVLDTDVASLSFKDQLPGEWEACLRGRVSVVSFVTVAELRQWAEVHGWGLRRRSAMGEWLGRRAVIDSDHAVSQLWGGVVRSGDQDASVTAVNDTWIATSCLAAQMPLATRNVKDFKDFLQAARVI